MTREIEKHRSYEYRELGKGYWEGNLELLAPLLKGGETIQELDARFPCLKLLEPIKGEQK